MMLWIALIAGAIPWIYTLAFTGWYTEDKGTLSSEHGLILLVLQVGLGLIVYFIGDWLKQR